MYQKHKVSVGSLTGQVLNYLDDYLDDRDVYIDDDQIDDDDDDDCDENDDDGDDDDDKYLSKNLQNP